MGRLIDRKNLGRLCVIHGITSCVAMVLVYLDLYYTRTHRSAMENQHETKSVLFGLLLVMFPFVGTAVAFLAACSGAVLGIFGLLQTGASKMTSLAGLALTGIALGVAMLFILGMGSFCQG